MAFASPLAAARGYQLSVSWRGPGPGPAAAAAAAAAACCGAGAELAALEQLRQAVEGPPVRRPRRVLPAARAGRRRW